MVKLGLGSGMFLRAVRATRLREAFSAPRGVPDGWRECPAVPAVLWRARAMWQGQDGGILAGHKSNSISVISHQLGTGVILPKEMVTLPPAALSAFGPKPSCGSKAHTLIDEMTPGRGLAHRRVRCKPLVTG